MPKRIGLDAIMNTYLSPSQKARLLKEYQELPRDLKGHVLCGLLGEFARKWQLTRAGVLSIVMRMKGKKK